MCYRMGMVWAYGMMVYDGGGGMLNMMVLCDGDLMGDVYGGISIWMNDGWDWI